MHETEGLRRFETRLDRLSREAVQAAQDPQRRQRRLVVGDDVGKLAHGSGTHVTSFRLALHDDVEQPVVVVRRLLGRPPATEVDPFVARASDPDEVHPVGFAREEVLDPELVRRAEVGRRHSRSRGLGSIDDPGRR